jgi:RNA polymerase sigma factor (sigma-70 family)
MFGKEVFVVSRPDPAISPVTHSAPLSAAVPGAHDAAALADLAVRLARFDEAAVEEFLNYFEGRLRNLFLQHGVPASEAEDLSCICIEKAVLNIHQYQPQLGKSFADWVFMIAYNRLRDWARRKAARPQADVPLEDIPLAKLEAPTATDDNEPEAPPAVTQAINEALAQLSAKEQEAVRLRYFDCVSDNAELAARLGIKVNAAKTRLSRALRKLKPLLEKDTRIKLTKH